jgi:hypothetical protein
VQGDKPLNDYRSSASPQLTSVARYLNVAPDDLRQAVIDADGGSGAAMLTLSVKVPRAGTQRLLPLQPDSLLSRTAGLLNVDPTESSVLKYDKAKAAAAQGDVWAGEWIRLVDRLRVMARRL